MQSHGLKADMTHYVTAELLAPTKAMQVGACLLRAGVEGGASRQVSAALACAMFKMIMNEDTQERCDSAQTEHGGSDFDCAGTPAVRTALAAQKVLSENAGVNFKTLAEAMKHERKSLSQPLQRKLDAVNKVASYERHMMKPGTQLLQNLRQELTDNKSRGINHAEGVDSNYGEGATAAKDEAPMTSSFVEPIVEIGLENDTEKQLDAHGTGRARCTQQQISDKDSVDAMIDACVDRAVRRLEREVGPT